MSIKSSHPNGNALLGALNPEHRKRFVERSELISLIPGQVLSDSEQSIEDVYFPTTAVLSVLSVMTNRIAVETAVIGFEGMSSLAVFHKVDSSPEQVIAQVPGEALRISSADFTVALAASPPMERLLHRFSQAIFTFAAHSSACNRQHSVVQRCARWLLTTHDRVPGDEFALTHLFLSQMLGVRRSSVTVAAEVLRSTGAVTYTRGKIHVLDRTMLRSRSCDCYDVVRSTYDRLLNGNHTPSPLKGISLSRRGGSIVGGGADDEAIVMDRIVTARIETPLADFDVLLALTKRLSQELRTLSAAKNGDVDRPRILKVSEELSAALDHLQVAEDEMRAQLAAVRDVRLDANSN